MITFDLLFQKEFKTAKNKSYMSTNFLKVKNYIYELGYDIDFEDEEEGIIVVNKSSEGINNMVIGVADPIVIVEQFLFELGRDDKEVYRKLLVKNRDIIHGAFVIDEESNKVIFRDTLQLENLDLNELESTFNSLALLLSEYTDEIIEFSKN